MLRKASKRTSKRTNEQAFFFSLCISVEITLWKCCRKISVNWQSSKKKSVAKSEENLDKLKFVSKMLKFNYVKCAIREQTQILVVFDFSFVVQLLQKNFSSRNILILFFCICCLMMFFCFFWLAGWLLQWRQQIWVRTI